jgi:hypothetical protein
LDKNAKGKKEFFLSFFRSFVSLERVVLCVVRSGAQWCARWWVALTPTRREGARGLRLTKTVERRRKAANI